MRGAPAPSPAEAPPAEAPANADRPVEETRQKRKRPARENTDAASPAEAPPAEASPAAAAADTEMTKGTPLMGAGAAATPSLAHSGGGAF